MKSIQPKKSHKKIMFIALIAAVVLLGLFAFLFISKTGPFSPRLDGSINLDKPSKEELEAGTSIKKDSTDPTKENKTQVGSDPAPEPQIVEGSDKKSVGAEITAVNQNDSNLQIRTLIQTVTNSGICNLSMTGPQGKTYMATAGVQALASSSTCKGFDIPLNQLSPGVWGITINFNNDELIATTSKEVTIK